MNPAKIVKGAMEAAAIGLVAYQALPKKQRSDLSHFLQDAAAKILPEEAVDLAAEKLHELFSPDEPVRTITVVED